MIDLKLNHGFRWLVLQRLSQLLMHQWTQRSAVCKRLEVTTVSDLQRKKITYIHAQGTSMWSWTIVTENLPISVVLDPNWHS